MRSRLLLGLACCTLGGCMFLSSPTGTMPRAGTMIPDTTINVTSSLALRMDKIVYWGVYASAAYLILDPLAPNWDIEQAEFPPEKYHLSLHMKRVYTGGAGEARVVFHRRAKELMAERGYDRYDVLEYRESLESSVLGSQRTAEGVIRLAKSDEN